jgi:hypothetical protein
VAGSGVLEVGGEWGHEGLTRSGSTF